jgi:hypothetical protein
MKKIKTIYYDGNNEIMFKEENFVSESPLVGDWITWHTLEWQVDRRVFDFDSKVLQIFCHQD